MDAAYTRLIGTLERLVSELSAGATLAVCLRALPRDDYRSLCAPLPPASTAHWPWSRARLSSEAVVLARIALAAGAEAPDSLAAALAQLVADLRDARR